MCLVFAFFLTLSGRIARRDSFTHLRTLARCANHTYQSCLSLFRPHILKATYLKGPKSDHLLERLRNPVRSVEVTEKKESAFDGHFFVILIDRDWKVSGFSEVETQRRPTKRMTFVL